MTLQRVVSAMFVLVTAMVVNCDCQPKPLNTSAQRSISQSIHLPSPPPLVQLREMSSTVKQLNPNWHSDIRKWSIGPRMGLCVVTNSRHMVGDETFLVAPRIPPSHSITNTVAQTQERTNPDGPVAAATRQKKPPQLDAHRELDPPFHVCVCVCIYYPPARRPVHAYIQEI